MNGIDYTIKNQVIIWGERGVIITSGEVLENYVEQFIGHCIIEDHNWHGEAWYKNKSEEWNINDSYELLPSLPSILKFKIHNEEKY